MYMFIRFDVEKNIEAVGVLLSTTYRRKMTRIRVLKLLYFANRESIKDTGFPIADDKFVAMDFGMVMSNTYDCIKGKGDAATEWNKHFATEMDKFVVMEHDPGADHLSDYAVDVLKATAKRYKYISDAQLIAATHDLEEYKKNFRGGHSSYPVSNLDILRAVGRDDAEEILAEGRAYQREFQLMGGKTM